MKEKYIKIENLSVSQVLYDFINNEAIPGTNISEKEFWHGFSNSVHELAPDNDLLIKFRKKLQEKIDTWHINHRDKDFDQAEYEKFLKKIKYLVKTGPDFKIKTENIDEEISKIPGPQLVCPIDNSRFICKVNKIPLHFYNDKLTGIKVYFGRN